MIIENSQVNLAAKASSYHYISSQQVTLNEREGTHIKLDTSPGADSLMNQVKEHQKEKEKQQKEIEKKNQQKMMELFKEENVKNREKASNIGDRFPEPEEDMTIKLLRSLLENLKKANGKKYNVVYDKNAIKTPLFIVSNKSTGATGSALTINNEGSNLGVNVTKMVKTTVVSSFEAHTENMAFEGVGRVQTKDGRSIDFGITLEMSQSFCREFESFAKQTEIFMDPLVINLNSSSANITNQKFLFDLDSDGKKENISFAGEGSGFLAYDKNGDGIINDGSELFGTKSGDGFADLAKYDSDGNGWIDEADDIYKKLKVWTKDADGNDKLLDLKEADVGAIFLGSANTNYTMYNMDTYDTNAKIRKTGLFLKESGGAGTVQHVDLAL